MSAFVYFDEAHDRDLEGRVRNFLGKLNRSGLKNLEIKALNGTITLLGSVASVYDRQLAIHGCRRVAGVRDLVDALQAEACPAEATQAEAGPVAAVELATTI